jgi:RNA polymerase sigma-70 factor (ECF subfamily)
MTARAVAEMTALLPRLRRFALMLTGSAADADDLVQATIERGIGRLDQWVRGTSLKSWLFAVAHNLHKNQRRDAANRLRLLEAHGREVDAVAEGVRERAAEAAVMLADVRRLVLDLPADQRAVLSLVAIEGLSYREAADLLDLPVGTVTSRLARAREALRAALAAPAGCSLEDA